jgi:hypothetical protein
MYVRMLTTGEELEMPDEKARQYILGGHAVEIPGPTDEQNANANANANASASA